MLAYTLFDTAIGCCGIGWRGQRVTRLQLPEADAETTRIRLARGGAVEGVPPEAVRAVRDGIRAHLDGDLDDLRWVDLDLAGVSEFDAKVYAITRAIDPGHTLRYGDVALRMRAPGAAQAVGQALGRNPIPLIVPCHRVLASGANPGGFSAFGGAVTKATLLAIERAPGFGEPVLF
ncbi:methylated-DNA--[protein]-cysteine S-methyltransferase [Aldersonia sp. NBC_00410]|uniref:methylated-DNA--[protein]-cysteine S-methyltransferase n=1 Tax=Aldersonia sp. NBC_00410 TaxID=2975954 RepID=UPI00224F0FB5|nr:methylated-DNA--[protein]-cysteine S-methyltransferase [Aldersonia sp. NBC_00410]MCX5041979.1 methylated-DNA--[protein]-cysteine S-methyltransferase [Aldersonia sp. NBC_00410]